MDVESEGSAHVTATYREIARHFGLSGPNAARTKVKRVGWPEEPVNHPADTRRVKVPRAAWNRALNRPEKDRSSANARPPTQRQARGPSQSSGIRALEGALTLLRRQLELEHARADAAELRETTANARADRADAATDHERRAQGLARGDHDRVREWFEERVRALEAELSAARAAAKSNARGDPERREKLGEDAGGPGLRHLLLRWLRRCRAISSASALTTADHRARVSTSWDTAAAKAPHRTAKPMYLSQVFDGLTNA